MTSHDSGLQSLVSPEGEIGGCQGSGIAIEGNQQHVKENGSATALAAEATALAAAEGGPTAPAGIAAALAGEGVDRESRDAEAQAKRSSLNAGDQDDGNASPDYMKTMAHQLLSSLNKDSLWLLTLSLQKRGWIQVIAAGDMLGFDRTALFPVISQYQQHTQQAVFQQKPQLQQLQSQQQQQLQQQAPVQVAPQEPQHRHEATLEVTTEMDALMLPPQSIPASAAPEATCHNDDTEEGLGAASALTKTLVLHNLPTSFDQNTTQLWKDDQGYACAQDFLLWFPAKHACRLNSKSYPKCGPCGFCSQRVSHEALPFPAS